MIRNLLNDLIDVDVDVSNWIVWPHEQSQHVRGDGRHTNEVEWASKLTLTNEIEIGLVKLGLLV